MGIVAFPGEAFSPDDEDCNKFSRMEMGYPVMGRGFTTISTPWSQNLWISAMEEEAPNLLPDSQHSNLISLLVLSLNISKIGLKKAQSYRVPGHLLLLHPNLSPSPHSQGLKEAQDHMRVTCELGSGL